VARLSPPTSRRRWRADRTGARACRRRRSRGCSRCPRRCSPPSRLGLGPFILLRVVDLDGATHEVVYVRRDDEALLGFAGATEWRLVPADDAQLLADAVAGKTPYSAPAAGAPFGRLFATDEPGGWSAGWLAVIALVGVAVVAVGVYAFTTASAGRPR
jgi:hypothetical protein